MDRYIYSIILVILSLTFLFEVSLSILNYKNRTAPIPEEVNDVYDQNDYRKWLRYSMENFRVNLIAKTISFLIIVLMFLFNGFIWVYNLIKNTTDSVYINTLLFIGIYFIIDFIIGILFSYYKRFYIEERFGFNKSTILTFVLDKLKSLILTMLIGGGLVLLLSYFYYNVKNIFNLFALAWGVIITLIILVNMVYVKFIPLFNKLSALEDGDLKDKIIEFAESVGYEVTKISVIDASKRSTKLNAFFTGMGKYKQVVLYDTLLDKMTENQIVSILAHEIGHGKKNHLIKNLLLSTVTITMYLGILLFAVKSEYLSNAFGFASPNFGFGLIIFMILISPVSILVGIITNSLSRKFEYEADHYAAIHGYEIEMKASLKVLARENYSNLKPHPFYVWLKYTHPPIASRIRAMKNNHKKN
ncbi:M48 family metallopeptidase [Haloplasma contractile]|uniref:Ste24 endopeptidase protein n=1 Tax=Haloplasma contractile SSD-17B TaxID=1033810 RepID=U2FJZ7_9MOLU|nr:M48 family metallopeptidase [Haloplasma contractile]ERJ13140.1 Ste24 endopeptidase protein [Haloplasma contractile SSD-17B]